MVFCVVKQKTAYELRISDWSSDVCSSDLPLFLDPFPIFRTNKAKSSMTRCQTTIPLTGTKSIRAIQRQKHLHSSQWTSRNYKEKMKIATSTSNTWRPKSFQQTHSWQQY